MKNLKEKNIEKKEINTNTSVKAIITGFVAYGIIFLFLCICAILVINMFLAQNSNITLTIIISIIEAIILYYVIHGICRLSTYDVFKKCKTNPDNINSISQKMNLFFIICIFVIVIISILFLFLKLDTLYAQIEISKIQYSQVFSQDFTNQLTTEMLDKYDEQKNHSIISTIIIELGLIVSIFSLVHYQKKILKTYNKYGK